MSAATILAALRNRPGYRFAMILALIVVADILMFARQPGINIFLFANAVTVTILLFGRTQMSVAGAMTVLAFLLLATAPLLETPSWMAMAITIAGIACVALWKAGLVPRNLTRLPLVLLRFALAFPERFFRGCEGNRRTAARFPKFEPVWEQLRVWVMPLGLASGFLLLFTIANPLIETAFSNIDLAFLLRFLDMWRIGFWLLIGTFLCVMLRPRLKRIHNRLTASVPTAQPSGNAIFGYASLLRCLLIFNMIFAIQTLLDLTYLWGGASLPGGMSHAEYAHRGAYPLIVTALLAAAFVLIAMRRNGPGDKSPLIRGLVHLWIAQNILLCLSSILRLDLYVEVYSLTELRVAAGIWMGLVAVGLLLILLRIMLNRTGDWLVSMSLLALTLTVYISALVDIPAFIARFNVVHSEELSGEGFPLDTRYLLRLGPSAIPALDIYLATIPVEATDRIGYARTVRDTLAFTFSHRQQDWSGWTWRNTRLETYLQETAVIAR